MSYFFINNLQPNPCFIYFGISKVQPTNLRKAIYLFQIENNIDVLEKANAIDGNFLVPLFQNGIMYKYWRFEDECFILHKQLIILFMSNIIIRDANLSDIFGIKNLYLKIIKVHPDNLLPFKNEITDDLIQQSLKASIKKGFAIVIEKDNNIIGYAQGYPSQNSRECHLIKDTRIIIHSDYVGCAIRLMNAVQIKVQTMRHIKYALFNVREHNIASAKCLKFFGCYEVCRYHDALLKCDGSFMDDVVYKWDNPNFSIKHFKQKLHQIDRVLNQPYQVYVDSFKESRIWSTNISNTDRYAS